MGTNKKKMNYYDYIIIGAGIVGLATSVNLKKNVPNLKILVLEKENELGVHQTGNNSGVIHSGIYYKPGSAKAINCRRGYKLLLDYCNINEIEYNICGKIIVATSQNEEERLDVIYNRGIENGLEKLKFLNSEQLKEQEPNVSGTKAIFVPDAGIIDFSVVLKSYYQTLTNIETEIKFKSEVLDLIERTDNVEVKTQEKSYFAKNVISCAGLQSDRVARKTKKNLDLKIVPFRGEYYKLKSEKKDLVKGLIYPVPDPSFPFLGVHFTKKINGELEAGPNAVLAFKREGYKKLDFNLKDSVDIFTWPGFQKVALKYWRTGFGEFYRSYNKSAFTRALQKLVPSVQKDDLLVGGAGVRAQACNRDGVLLDDFEFVKSKRILHVCNAPSPAATASLAIGEYIADKILN